MAEEVFGKLYSKEDADSQFGAVLTSKEIESSRISELFSRSGDILMFNIIENEVVIMGRGRTVLYPDNGAKVEENAVFHVYSNSVIQELLEKGGQPITYVEIRSEVLSLTNGNTTMELAGECPPYC